MSRTQGSTQTSTVLIKSPGTSQCQAATPLISQTITHTSLLQVSQSKDRQSLSHGLFDRFKIRSVAKEEVERQRSILNCFS